MKNIFNLIGLLLVIAAVAFAPPAAAQSAITQTTLSAAQGVGDTVALVTSTTGMTAANNGAIAGIIYIDREPEGIVSFNSTTNVVQVLRAYGGLGSPARAHNSGNVVFAGTPSQFLNADPSPGACTPSALPVTPVISLPTGTQWVCDANSNQWAITGKVFTVPAANCSISQSGGTETVASVLKIVGNLQAVQETTTTTTATDTVICAVPVPSALASGRGIVVTGANLKYGNSTGAIATCNAPTVGTQTGPAPGTSETAASATLVTAGGTLTVTPAVGSCNTAALSAGQQSTENISFGTPVLLNNDRQTLYV